MGRSVEDLLERIDSDAVESVGEASYERSAFYRTADEVGKLLEDHLS